MIQQGHKEEDFTEKSLAEIDSWPKCLQTLIALTEITTLTDEEIDERIQRLNS